MWNVKVRREKKQEESWDRSAVRTQVMEEEALECLHRCKGPAAQLHRSPHGEPSAKTLGVFFLPALVINPERSPGVFAAAACWLPGTVLKANVAGRAAYRAFETWFLFLLTPWHTKHKKQEGKHACFHWQVYRASWSEKSYNFCWWSWKQIDDLGYYVSGVFFPRRWMKEWC